MKSFRSIALLVVVGALSVGSVSPSFAAGAGGGGTEHSGGGGAGGAGGAGEHGGGQQGGGGEQGGHNGGMHDGNHAGLGIDIRGAGHSRDEHRRFFNNFDEDDQNYVRAVCLIPYRYRTPEEKAFCISIGE